MTFGERLKLLRKKKKLSQQALSDRIGLNRATYARYETNDNQPDYDTLQKLADFFDVKIDYLLGRTNDTSPSNNNFMMVRESGAEYKTREELLLTSQDLNILEEMKKYPVFFNDLASDPTKIKKVIKMWEFYKKEIENDDDEEPED